MKVSELRQLLKAADREGLEKAFVENYKLLRKAQKEEMDVVLSAILKGEAAEKKEENTSADFEKLEQQIRVFLENAYAQNYYAPNRIVPKSQRPKWRFMVKNFIKELGQISPENEHYPRAVKLLTDLYRMICYACNYYLFSTEDAFRSIGWEQPEFFDLVVRKTFAAGYSRENVSSLLVLAATGGLSRDSLHIEQETVFLNCLKTSDVKYIAIEEAQKLIEDKEEKLSRLKKYDNGIYETEDAVNELCNMILMLAVSLAEPQKGVDYYFKHAKHVTKEITLYCILDVIDLMNEDELWIKVYECGMKEKIKPRDSLQREYAKRKEKA